ncbi:MAG: hypothetical protein Kow00108_00390 [Calditrichia bacterium]
MRILHIINSLEFGGAETVVINIANQLHSPKYQQSILSLSNNNPLSKRIKKQVQFFAIQKQFKNKFHFYSELRSFFKDQKFDLIMIHGYGVAADLLIASALLKGTKFILMDHGRVMNLPKSSIIKRKIKILLYKRIQKFIAVSNQIKNEMINEFGLESQKIEVIYNGIPDNFLNNKIRSMENRDKTILFVGRLAEVKNVTTLLKALQLLIEDSVMVKLILVGDGPLRNSLEQTAKDLNLGNNISFLGFKSDVRQYYEIADCFVLPSYYEGISIALLEAMAYGLPVIASNVGGNKEIIKHNRNGYLFEPDDYKTLARYIHDILEKKEIAIKMANNNLADIRNNFVLSVIKEKYVNLFNRVVNREKD